MKKSLIITLIKAVIMVDFVTIWGSSGWHDVYNDFSDWSTDQFNQSVQEVSNNNNYGDPYGHPFVPNNQLPLNARQVLSNRKLMSNGKVALASPVGYKAVPATRGGGILLVPPGWTPGSSNSVIRVQPPGTTASSNQYYNGNGYYVVYNDKGQPISPYDGQTVPPAQWHNPYDPVQSGQGNGGFLEQFIYELRQLLSSNDSGIDENGNILTEEDKATLSSYLSSWEKQNGIGSTSQTVPITSSNSPILSNELNEYFLNDRLYNGFIRPDQW